MSKSKATSKSEAVAEITLKKGDIVINHWAGKENDLHVITGSVTRKIDQWGNTHKFYKARCLFKGKLCSEGQFDARDHRLEKIGHFDYEARLKSEMQLARESWAFNRVINKPKGK